MRKVALLFDGACGLCQASVRRIRALDFLGRVELLDAAADWPAIQKRFPSLTQQACLEEMHLILAGGSAVTGFDAYRALAWVLPIGWLALPFLYLPGVRSIGRRVYARVAGSRSRGSCRIRRAGV